MTRQSSRANAFQSPPTAALSALFTALLAFATPTVAAQQQSDKGPPTTAQQEAKSTDAAPSSPKPADTADKGTLAVDPQTVGRVELLSRWMESGAKVEQKDAAGDAKHGLQIQDVVLDLEAAQVALLIVSRQPTGNANTGNSKPSLAGVPYTSSIKQEDSKFWTDLTAEPPQQIKRSLAAAVYQAAKREIYWSQYVATLPAGASEKFDREQFELTAFSKLQGHKIVDLNGKAIGTLIDFGIRKQTGDIAYCVVDSSGKLRAIPLGAFLHRDAKEDWKIELTEERILQFEPFPADAAPQDIDRGWKEYVAVRYGRDALQVEPGAKRDATDEKSERANRGDKQTQDKQDCDQPD